VIHRIQYGAYYRNAIRSRIKDLHRIGRRYTAYANDRYRNVLAYLCDQLSSGRRKSWV
jgi:hypothetical protein